MHFLNRIIIISLILTLSGCNINKNTYQLKDHSRQLSQLEINNAEKMFEAISLNRIDDALPIMGTKLKEDLKDSVFFEYLSVQSV